MDKDLKIIILGRAATGKSTMMLLLEQFLKEKGFEVAMQMEEELIDYGTERNMRRIFNENIDERVNALKQNVKITLEQRQAKFDFTKNIYEG